ncbi:MAG: hypothetical protein U0841_12415 [Chloroflexia bacterium]
MGWRLMGLAALGRRAQRMLLLALLVPVGVVGLWWLARPVLPPPVALSSRLSAETLERYFSVAALGHHLAGIVFDRATGLIPASPLLLLAPVGLIGLVRRAPRGLAGADACDAVRDCGAARGWLGGVGAAGALRAAGGAAAGAMGAGAWEGWSRRWLRYVGGALVAWGWVVAVFLAWVPHAAYYLVSGRKWFGDVLLCGVGVAESAAGSGD